jgi:hypothetical protein
MKNVIVTKEVLDIYDKFVGDFGVLDERGANEGDREKVTNEQCFILGQYVDKLEFTQLKPGLYSVQMREAAAKRIGELEELIDDEVVAILRRRLLGS